METVTHGGRSTAYRSVTGNSDPTVLYVHGSGGTHRLWSAQYGADGPTGSAAALDLSGHGASDDVETAAGMATLRAYVDDAAAVAEAVGADVVVGNSLGGAVVLWGVLNGALSPSAIVLAGTGAKLTVHERLRELLADDFSAAVDTLHGPDMLFHDSSLRLREQSVETMRAVGQTVTRRDFETCHRFDVRDRLDEIDVATLAVCGEYDKLTPPAFHEFLADHIPDVRVEQVPEAAHLAMAERPGAFNEALASFFDEHFDG